jgi:hypothetical protein
MNAWIVCLGISVFVVGGECSYLSVYLSVCLSEPMDLTSVKSVHLILFLIMVQSILAFNIGENMVGHHPKG